LEAAAEALVDYPGRQTDDGLLGEVEVAWAEYEELTEQQYELFLKNRREP
jgi:hypothetical protein